MMKMLSYLKVWVGFKKILSSAIILRLGRVRRKLKLKSRNLILDFGFLGVEFSKNFFWNFYFENTA